ncbi:TetR/AcrR family transcriptional regulator [Marinomonas pollencensis]|uniref:TetR family transcriptional regulator n=1 Tax=Marinomonas pollencensis TaxID=491954 RepID=A0A3E0DLE6_9GAMM|nr:TetR/AcrR family transcriptional regulator [Marinomonas pollencensis]REG83660.1 TetR family transcriptional regulator [Marinomonas pollencensis]
MTSEQQQPQDPKAILVLEAATKIFLQYGFSASTTDMIQKEAGVSKATVYNRYPNKEALFFAVVKQGCWQTTSQLKRIQTQSVSLERVLTEFGNTYLTMTLSAHNLALFRTAAAEALRFPNIANTFYNSGPKATIEIVSEYLERAADHNEINIQSIGVEPAAALFISMLRGEGHMIGVMFPEAVPSKIQIEQWTKNAVQTFMKAFAV